MPRPTDLATFFCAAGFVCVNLFATVIWSVGLIRTGLRFFYVMVFVSVFGLVLSIVNLCVYYSPSFFLQVFGPERYALLFYVYIYSLLLNSLAGLVGATMIVRWICKSTRVSAG